MKSSGLFRIGRDAELRQTPAGQPVANVSLAFNYGRKGEDGNRPTQWIDAAIFGQRAEVLAPMLAKGSQHVFHLSDLHIETYEGRNGTGHKLVAFVDDVELTDRRRDDQGQQAQAPRQAAPQQARRPEQNGYQDARGGGAPRQPAPTRASSGFDDFDSDVPF